MLQRMDRAIVATLGEEGLREMGSVSQEERTSLESLLFQGPDSLADSAQAADPDQVADSVVAEGIVARDERKRLEYIAAHRATPMDAQ